jgi:amino acid permease
MFQSKFFKIKWIFIGVFICCAVVILIMIWIHRSSTKLPEERFVDVYVKLSIANVLFTSDSLKLKEEKKKIFELAKVTPEQMDSFVKIHNQKPEQWVRIWKRILEKLEQSRQEIKSP